LYYEKDCANIEALIIRTLGDVTENAICVNTLNAWAVKVHPYPATNICP
jgi:hypothetical protein